MGKDDVAELRFGLNFDGSKLTAGIENACKKINDSFKKSVEESAESATKAAETGNAEIDAILNDTERSAKSKAASIAAIYKKAGASSQEAFKKAWENIERDSSSTTKKVNKNTSSILDKIKNTFRGIKTGSKTTKESVKKDTDDTTSSIDGASSKIISAAKKIGGILASAFAVKSLISFGKSCIDLGSDLAEVQNVVDVTFGSMSDKVNEYAKNAMTTVGLSETMAKQFTGNYGAMAKAFGFTTDAAYEMSTSLTTLAGDVASFYNLDQEEAYTKLKSVFTGETESLKELGVVMSQTALDSYALANGFGKTTSEMTEAEKVSLRYAFVQDRLAAASGDFSRTSGGWANQMRVLNLQFESFKATIGQGLINALTPALQMLNKLLAKIQTVAEAFNKLTEEIFGYSDTGSGTAAVASDMDAAAESTDAMGESLKKASRYLAGFDVMTKVSSSSDTDTSTDTTSNAAATTAASTSVTKTASDVKTESFEKIKKIIDDIKTSIDNIKEPLSYLWNEILVPLGKWTGETILNAIQGIVGDIKWLTEHPKVALAIALPLAAVGVCNTIDKLKENWSNMSGASKLALAISVAVTGWNLGHSIYENLTGDYSGQYTLGFMETMSFIGDVVINDTDTAKKAWDNMWGDMAVSLDAMAPWIYDGLSSIGDFFTDLWTNIKNTFSNIGNWFSQTFTAAANGVKNAFASIGRFFSDIWTGIKNTFSSIGNWFSQMFTAAANGIKNAFASIGSFFTNIWANIKNTFSNIGNWFTQKFTSATNGIKNAFSSVGNFFKNVWSSIKNVFANIPNWFKTKFSDAWKKVKDVFSSGGKVFEGIKEGILGELKSIINGLIGGINDVIAVPFGGIKDALDAIRDVSIVGAKPFSGLPTFDVPQIPLLANGGYVKANTPQLAMIGDNRHQGEVVSPEDKLLEMAYKAASMAGGDGSQLNRIIALLEQLISIVQDGADIVLMVDGEELARANAKGAMSLKRRYTTTEVDFA